MPIIQIIIVLILLGFGLWVINFLPINATIKQIIIGLAIVLVVIWVLLIVGGMLGYSTPYTPLYHR